MRRKRVRKLADKIEKHGRRFDMGTWFDITKPDLVEEKVVVQIIEEGKPICGTTACVAGWAVFMFGTRKQIESCIKDDGNFSRVGAKLLGFDEDQSGVFGSSGDAKTMAAELRDMADNA